MIVGSNPDTHTVSPLVLTHTCTHKLTLLNAFISDEKKGRKGMKINLRVEK